MVLGILKTIIFIFPEPKNKNIIDYHQNIDCEKFQQQQKRLLGNKYPLFQNWNNQTKLLTPGFLFFFFQFRYDNTLVFINSKIYPFISALKSLFTTLYTQNSDVFIFKKKKIKIKIRSFVGSFFFIVFQYLISLETKKLIIKALKPAETAKKKIYCGSQWSRIYYIFIFFFFHKFYEHSKV